MQEAANKQAAANTPAVVAVVPDDSQPQQRRRPLPLQPLPVEMDVSSPVSVKVVQQQAEESAVRMAHRPRL
jgi:hypothetical protein